jgi:hypothetical protein
MARMFFTAEITEDRQNVLIQLLQEDKPPGHIICDASSLDAFIRQLATCRQHLAEEVVPSLEPGSRVEIERNPSWTVTGKRHQTDPEVTSALRHRGFGWLGFLLDKERALAIGGPDQQIRARRT